LEEHHTRLSFLSAVICKPNGGIHRFPSYGEGSFQILRLYYLLVLAIKYDELDDRGHLVAPAGGKDFGLFPVSRQPNEISEIKFRHFSVRFPPKSAASPAQQNQGANQPSTSGQGGANQQQAPAQQTQGANQPSTSGQSDGSQQQAPAQQSHPAGQGQQNSGNK